MGIAALLCCKYTPFSHNGKSFGVYSVQTHTDHNKVRISQHNIFDSSICIAEAV